MIVAPSLRFHLIARTPGARYEYGFAPDNDPDDRINMTTAHMIFVLCWCREQFGEADWFGGVKPDPARWRGDMHIIDIAQAVDAIAFRLRWC